mmetsp:Transcript_73935/g.175964  ORF Transcript_73935/g.175964 Transcript_73935/m.175964 type:complete len:235 (-) Transcript_73935:28-732(-)
MAATRADGRTSNQLRPPQVELRPLQRADGSARFCFGQSTAIAAVYGPREPRVRAKEVFNKAVLEVVVRPRVGLAGAAEKHLEGHLLRHLDHVVLHHEYPRTVISVIVQLYSTDGSMEAVAGNAAFLALMDAGVAMRSTALCVSIGVQMEEAVGDASAILLDPNEAEERDCDAVVSMGIDNQRGCLVSSFSTGEALDAVEWAKCVDAGLKACKVLENFLRMSLQKRLAAFVVATG